MWQRCQALWWHFAMEVVCWCLKISENIPSDFLNSSLTCQKGSFSSQQMKPAPRYSTSVDFFFANFLCVFSTLKVMTSWCFNGLGPKMAQFQHVGSFSVAEWTRSHGDVPLLSCGVICYIFRSCIFLDMLQVWPKFL